MEALELQGLWWIPEHADHQVPGVLTWVPSTGGTLRLIGQLWPVVLLDNELPNGQVQKYRDRTYDSRRSYPVVLGQVENKSYTLLNVFQTMKGDWSLEQSSETVYVNAVLEGAFFDGPELEVDRAQFQMRDLSGWVNVSGLDVTYPRMDRTGNEFAVVSATERPDLVVPSAGPRVTLRQRLFVSRKGNESAGIGQDWVLHVDQEQVAPLRTFVEVASDLQDLVSIATGRTAEFRRVVLLHPDLPQRSLAGTPMGKARQELIYHARWTNRVDYDSGQAKDREPMSASHMYFTLDHLGADGLGRFLDTAVRFRTELGRAMATRYSRGAYLEDRIMNLCAALESFDKHHRGTDDDVWYVKRIAACVDLTGDVFCDLIAERPDVWSKQVKDLRHDLAHHRNRFRLDGSVGGHVVAEQLFWLFALCMLRVAQAPDAVTDSIVKHQHWEWLRNRARETLPSVR